MEVVAIVITIMNIIDTILITIDVIRFILYIIQNEYFLRSYVCGFIFEKKNVPWPSRSIFAFLCDELLD